MSAPLTPFCIARLWSQAIAADPFITRWAQDNYQRPFSISIGADMRRSPDEDGAPFIVIFPDTSNTGPQKKTYVSSLDLVAGIADGEIAPNGPVIEMRGLQRLDELCPMLERAMRMALPKARLQDIRTDYETLQFPLCEALLSITVEEDLPVGRRL